MKFSRLHEILNLLNCFEYLRSLDFENFKLGNNIPNLVHNRSIVKSMANSMQGKNCRIH